MGVHGDGLEGAAWGYTGIRGQNCEGFETCFVSKLVQRTPRLGQPERWPCSPEVDGTPGQKLTFPDIW